MVWIGRLPTLQTRDVRHATEHKPTLAVLYACKRIHAPLSDRHFGWRIMVVSIRLELSHTIASCLTKSTKLENSDHRLYET